MRTARRGIPALLAVLTAGVLVAVGAQTADAAATSTSKTYDAWTVFRSCHNIGTSYAPCSRDDRWGGTNGVEFSSDGAGAIFTVAATLPLPSGAKSWRLKFVKTDSDPDFAWSSSASDQTDSTKWLHTAMFPSDAPNGTTMTTPWVAGSGTARFVIRSVTWSTLDIRSVVLETSSTVKR